MQGHWKEVVRLHFKGDRFRDHALDLLALSELSQFQRLVAETAKSLVRAAPPNRELLPRHFEERTRLCLRQIEEGSAVAPLEVFLEEPDQHRMDLWEEEPQEPEEVSGALEMPYEDAVDAEGEVFEADVRQCRFQLWRGNDHAVTVSFDEQQEDKVTTALKEHRLLRLRGVGRGEDSPEG